MQYESKVYSQNGEDGIIAEIFKRIGTTNRRFVEIGVSNGLECNTLSLLLNNWSGLWIEGSSKDVFFIKKNFHQPIQQSSLRIQEHFVDRENINTILMETQFTGEIDLLSLDIDGNDYHVIERGNCKTSKKGCFFGGYLFQDYSNAEKSFLFC